jgi:hypothetical protein
MLVKCNANCTGIKALYQAIPLVLVPQCRVAVAVSKKDLPR